MCPFSDFLRLQKQADIIQRKTRALVRFARQQRDLLEKSEERHRRMRQAWDEECRDL